MEAGNLCSVSVFFVRVGSQISPRRPTKTIKSPPHALPPLTPPPPPPPPPRRLYIDRCITAYHLLVKNYLGEGGGLFNFLLLTRVGKLIKWRGFIWEGGLNRGFTAKQWRHQGSYKQRVRYSLSWQPSLLVSIAKHPFSVTRSDERGWICWLRARRLPFRRAKDTIIMRKIYQSPLLNDKNSFRKSVYKTITLQISAVRTGVYVRIWMLRSWIL